MIEPLAIAPRRRRPLRLAMSAVLAAFLALSWPPAVAAGSSRSGEGASYVLFAPGSRSTTMSGSMEDLRRARSLRSGGEALLYVRQGGSAYVIRDAATLREARAIFEPQEALGSQQAELGSRQAALGQRQAALGAQQARLGSQQAGASPARAVQLGRQQEALGRQQDALGIQQDALGRRQSALGREQERLARIADTKFRALLAEAIRRGVARRVD
jgi:hypothetical protein